MAEKLLVVSIYHNFLGRLTMLNVDQIRIDHPIYASFSFTDGRLVRYKHVDIVSLSCRPQTEQDKKPLDAAPIPS